MPSLLEFPSAVWAKVISYKYYVITAVLEDSLELVRVHSPGTAMSGSFKAEVRILINPYPDFNKKRKTTYYILAVESKDYLMGANPSLGNRIFRNYLEKIDRLFDISSFSEEVLYGNSRFDFLFVNATGKPSYVEVKSCFFEHDRICYFPLKHLSDLPKLTKIPKNYSPMSARAIKHFKQLIFCKGILVFVANHVNFDEFMINPRETELAQLYDQITNKYLLKVQWTYDKKVNFSSIKRL